jgi:hypothetical protein
MAKDPVCGMEVAERKAAGQVNTAMIILLLVEELQEKGLIETPDNTPSDIQA